MTGPRATDRWGRLRAVASALTQLRQDVIVKFPPDPESRRVYERVDERLRLVNQTSMFGLRNHAEKAGHCQARGAGRPASATLVNQEHVGTALDGQNDGFSLAQIELAAKCLHVAHILRSRHDDPGHLLDGGQAGRPSQAGSYFVEYTRRDQDLLIQPVEKVEPINPGKAEER
jgi:hypothetical protein